MRASAETKALRRWAFKDERAEFPWACAYRGCHRYFRTKRGMKQHGKGCSYNPDAKMFTSGAYDPLVKNGQIVGVIYNGDSDLDRQRIRSGFVETMGVLGMDTSGDLVRDDRAIARARHYAAVAEAKAKAEERKACFSLGWHSSCDEEVCACWCHSGSAQPVGLQQEEK